jgi:peptidylprolyl isomerase
LSLLQVIKGWQEGLLGVPVGSQVLLVIPPELAYGSEDKPNIPPNSTLIFVVDIVFAS